MRTIAAKYPANSAFSAQVTAAKLKLKNACPDALDHKLYRLEKRAAEKLGAMFGLKPPTPIAVHALADLHYEAQYVVDGELVRPEPNQCPWQAARAYVAHKDLEVNLFPGKPLHKQSTSSSSSSLSLASSSKSVRFADIEAKVRVFDTTAAPKNL